MNRVSEVNRIDKCDFSFQNAKIFYFNQERHSRILSETIFHNIERARDGVTRKQLLSTTKQQLVRRTDAHIQRES